MSLFIFYKNDPNWYPEPRDYTIDPKPEPNKFKDFLFTITCKLIGLLFALLIFAAMLSFNNRN